MNPEFTIISHAISAADAAKGFMVCDAMKHSDMTYADVAKMGFTCDAAAIKRVMDADPEYKQAVEMFAKDAGFELGDANIDALGQFFLVWNETEINRLYRGRTAVSTFGVKQMGDWLTEKVVFKTRELAATKAGLYDDFSRPTFVGYKYGYDSRDTLRMEWGIEVTKREEMVGSVMRRNPYKDKKDALLLANEIWENNFFWNGATLGKKKLYGVLNEVNLRSATNLPKAEGGHDISEADVTLAEVIATLRFFKQNMANDLQGNGDIDTLSVKIVCPLAWQQAFTVSNEVMMMSAYDWLAKNWKNAHVEFKPELSDKCIVFTESVPGVGLDTINLARTSALRLVGAMPSLKGREEAYSSSVAGALIAAPLGIRVYVKNS